MGQQIRAALNCRTWGMNLDLFQNSSFLSVTESTAAACPCAVKPKRARLSVLIWCWSAGLLFSFQPTSAQLNYLVEQHWPCDRTHEHRASFTIISPVFHRRPLFSTAGERTWIISHCSLLIDIKVTDSMSSVVFHALSLCESLSLVVSDDVGGTGRHLRGAHMGSGFHFMVQNGAKVSTYLTKSIKRVCRTNVLWNEIQWLNPVVSYALSG